MALKKAEVWAELAATDENFVRDKFMKAGYSPAKQRLVGQWLAELDNRRATERAELAARTTARWTKVGAVATAMTFLLAVALAVAPLFK